LLSRLTHLSWIRPNLRHHYVSSLIPEVTRNKNFMRRILFFAEDCATRPCLCLPKYSREIKIKASFLTLLYSFVSLTRWFPSIRWLTPDIVVTVGEVTLSILLHIKRVWTGKLRWYVRCNERHLTDIGSIEFLIFTFKTSLKMFKIWVLNIDLEQKISISLYSFPHKHTFGNAPAKVENRTFYHRVGAILFSKSIRDCIVCIKSKKTKV